METLVEKYRSTDKDCMLNYKRFGVLQDDGEVVLELKLRKINFFAMPNKTVYKMKHAYHCFVAKSEKVLDLEKKMARLLNNYMMIVRRERSVLTSKCRLWCTSDTKFDDLKAIDQKYLNYTHAKTTARPVSCTDSQKMLRVDDLNFVDDDCFIVETPKAGNFVLSHQDDDDEENKDSIANKIAEMAQENDAPFSMDALMAKDFASLLRGGAQGICGL